VQGDCDMFPHQTADHLFRIRDRRIQVHGNWLDHFLPAEGQQLPSEAGAALAGFPDLFRIVPQRIFRTQFPGEQRAVAVNHRQQVIEIVRDSTGQAADTFQFLGLPELSLEFRALVLGALPDREVRDEGHKRRPLVELHVNHPDEHGELRSVAAQSHGLIFRRYRQSLGAAKGPFGNLDTALGSKELQRGASRQFAGILKTEHLQIGGIREGHLAPARYGNRDRRLLGEGAEASFAVPQVHLGPLAVRDVQNADQRSPRVPNLLRSGEYQKASGLVPTPDG
jgi:hypothetical protein